MTSRQFLGVGLLLSLALACGGAGDVATPDGTVVPRPVEPDGPEAPAPLPSPAVTTELEPLVFALPSLDLIGDPGEGAAPEAEPNDGLQTATPLASAGGRGSLDGVEDEDLWSFEVDEPGLWGIDIHGEGVTQAHLETANGRLQTFRNTAPGLVRLEALGLASGTHFVRLRRGEGTYRVKASRLADNAAGLEREPNDTSGTAHRLQLGVTRGGWLSGAKDADVYRFSLRATEHVRLRWTSEVELKVRLVDRSTARSLVQGRFDSEAVPGWDGWLQPGDYELELKTTSQETGSYAVAVERLDPFAPDADREPNDVPDQVAPTVVGARVEGSIGPLDRRDLHRLPRRPGAAVTLRSVGDDKPPTKVSVRDGADKVVSEWDAAAGVWRATLPAEGPAFLHVGHPGEYAIEVVVDGWEPTAAATAPSGTVTPSVAKVVVAAFADVGQQVTVPLEVQGATGPLRVHVSDDRWRARVASGAVVVELPADVPAVPGVVTVGGGAQSASFVIDPVCGATPSGPRVHWALPDALVGGLDVAWLGLGASLVDGPDAAARLFDHVSPKRRAEALADHARTRDSRVGYGAG